MKKFAIIGLIPLITGFLYAQDQRRTETTTTTTTLNGRLVDAACQNTHSEHSSSSTTTNPDQSVTTKHESSRSESANCPVTTTTTTFGLMTSDGRFIRFDEPSNTRVIQVVRKNKAYLTNAAPVSVVGAVNGDVAVVQSIDTQGGNVAVEGEASRVRDLPKDAEVMFDVRYHDQQGRLIVSPVGLSFEDLSNANHSRSWNYAQLKELKRNGGNEIKIQPYSGDSYEFHVDGPFMSDTVYNMIADRIIAARGH